MLSDVSTPYSYILWTDGSAASLEDQKLWTVLGWEKHSVLEKGKDFVPVIPGCSDTTWTEESHCQRQRPQC